MGIYFLFDDRMFEDHVNMMIVKVAPLLIRQL